MKLCTFIFIVFVFWIITPKAKANDLHNYAYCSGYASKMAKIYKIKYYHDMQKYFDSKIEKSNIDTITYEYYQSGYEIVRNNVAISNNLINKCEELYKVRIP